MVDVSKIEAGDEIEVRLRVINNDPGQAGLLVDNGMPNGGRISRASGLITAHHPKPKPLAVGDKVKDESGAVWEIAAPRRRSAAIQAAEYAMWRDGWGYSYEIADSVDV